MTYKEKLDKLKQNLERWKAHNEIHAKASDNILYEFLSDLLKLAENDDQIQQEDYPQEMPTDHPEVVNDDAEAESERDGGNNPGAPDIP